MRAAFSRLLRVTMSRARMSLSRQVHHRLARGHRILVAAFVGRGRAGGIHQRQPDGLRDAGHGVGGELAAAGPGTGAGDPLEYLQLGIAEIAGLMLADRLEHVLHGHILAVQPPRQDRPAVDEDRRHVQADHRHHHPRQGLVAARKPDQRVIAMAAHGQLDRIGNRIARGQRRAHPLVPHGDAVGHGDGGELARGAVGVLDAQLDRLGLTIERDVAGRGLVPAGGDADEGLVDLLLGQTHRVEIRPVRRAGGALGHMAARQSGFVGIALLHLATLLRNLVAPDLKERSTLHKALV